MTVQHTAIPALKVAQPSNGLARLAPPAATDHDKLVHKTQVWVAQTFFGTLLKQMHDSPFKSDLFNGGRGGQAVGALYDQHLCERMAKGVGSKLVNSIVRRIEAKAGYAKQSTTKPTTKAAKHK